MVVQNLAINSIKLREFSSNLYHLQGSLLKRKALRGWDLKSYNQFKTTCLKNYKKQTIWYRANRTKRKIKCHKEEVVMTHKLSKHRLTPNKESDFRRRTSLINYWKMKAKYHLKKRNKRDNLTLFHKNKKALKKYSSRSFKWFKKYNQDLSLKS